MLHIKLQKPIVYWGDRMSAEVKCEMSTQNSRRGRFVSKCMWMSHIEFKKPTVKVKGCWRSPEKFKNWKCENLVNTIRRMALWWYHIESKKWSSRLISTSLISIKQKNLWNLGEWVYSGIIFLKYAANNIKTLMWFWSMLTIFNRPNLIYLSLFFLLPHSLSSWLLQFWRSFVSQRD